MIDAIETIAPCRRTPPPRPAVCAFAGGAEPLRWVVAAVARSGARCLTRSHLWSSPRVETSHVFWDRALYEITGLRRVGLALHPKNCGCAGCFVS